MNAMSASERPHPTRIAIVGAGNVGATYAYALLLNRLSAEIVLIDANRAKAEGEAMDLNHAVPFAHATRIWAGDFSDCAGAVITVVTAGAGQRSGETRLDMVSRNAEIWRQIIPRIVEHNPHGILLIATNPVDVLTYVALKLSGLLPERVIGSGTILDTARFRSAQPALSRGCPQRARLHHRRARRQRGSRLVVGQHCRDEARDFCRAQEIELDSATRQRIYEETRDAAYHIIERKRATYYGVASGLVRITAAFFGIRTRCSSFHPDSRLLRDRRRLF